MSPALNRSSALQHFERSNAIEIRNRIMFDFYPGLPHMYIYNVYILYETKIEESEKVGSRRGSNPGHPWLEPPMLYSTTEPRQPNDQPSQSYLYIYIPHRWYRMPQSHTWQPLYVHLITFKFQCEERCSEQFGINLITLELYRMPPFVYAPLGDRGMGRTTGTWRGFHWILPLCPLGTEGSMGL